MESSRKYDLHDLKQQIAIYIEIQVDNKGQQIVLIFGQAEFNINHLAPTLGRVK